MYLLIDTDIGKPVIYAYRYVIDIGVNFGIDSLRYHKYHKMSSHGFFLCIHIFIYIKIYRPGLWIIRVHIVIIWVHIQFNELFQHFPFDFLLLLVNALPFSVCATEETCVFSFDYNAEQCRPPRHVVHFQLLFEHCQLPIQQINYFLIIFYRFAIIYNILQFMQQPGFKIDSANFCSF